MFYEESEISNILNCPNCSSKYKDPKALPCGDIICGLCASKKTKEFKCLFCSKTHIIPDEGLPNSNLVMKLLEIKADEVYRSENVNILKNNLNKIQKEINELTFGINNGTDYIKEHCLNVRNEIQFATDTIFKEVNDLSESMIDQVKKYEQERIKDYRGSKKFPFYQVVEELKGYYEKWSDYLKKSLINEEDIFDANALAFELQKKSIKEKNKLHKFNFNKVYLNYEKSLKNIDQNVLGILFSSKEEALSYEKFHALSIKNLFPDYSSGFIIERFENGKYFVKYYNTEGYLELKVLNENKQIEYTYQSNSKQEVVYKIVYNSIFVFLIGDEKYLKYLNEKLEEKISFNMGTYERYYKDLSFNDSKLYCLGYESSGCFVDIYDMNLKLIKTISQYNILFNFPKEIKQMEIRNGKYYLLGSSDLNIVDETSETLVKTILINADKFYISNDNLVFISSKTILYYDLEGRKLKEIELVNFPDKLVSFLDINGDLSFFDVIEFNILYL